MKKFLSSILALSLVLGLAFSAHAQTYNFNTIVGSGNRINNVNTGPSFGPTYNNTNIYGHGNAVNNVNQGWGLGGTFNNTNIYGNGNAVNNLNLRPTPVYPVAPGYAPYRPVTNNNQIYGNFNGINNINQ